MGEKNEFWTTLPGILSGIAGIITALATLLGILYSMGFIGLHQRGSVTEQSPAKVESKDIITSHALKKLENEMAELDRSLEILEKKGKEGFNLLVLYRSYKISGASGKIDSRILKIHKKC